MIHARNDAIFTLLYLHGDVVSHYARSSVASKGSGGHT